MFGKKKSPPVSKIETVIGPTTNLKGTIRSDGGVRIDGVYEGSLETAGNLIIGEEAKVIADIVAHNVSISGALKGNITAKRVEVLSTGKIWGDVKVNSFLVDEGGFIRGEITIQGADIEPPFIEGFEEGEKIGPEQLE
jgi:cytoskeletal protein CcmA (bactofilin family)